MNLYFSAGDLNHETFDAEAQILNGNFAVYKNDHCKSVQFTDLAANLGASHTMSMRVTKFGLERQAPSYKKECSNCLFDWSTMYLGLNRVADTSGYGWDRVGKGLCQVCLTWEPRNFCQTPIISEPVPDGDAAE